MTIHDTSVKKLVSFVHGVTDQRRDARVTGDRKLTVIDGAVQVVRSSYLPTELDDVAAQMTRESTLLICMDMGHEKGKTRAHEDRAVAAINDTANKRTKAKRAKTTNTAPSVVDPFASVITRCIESTRSTFTVDDPPTKYQAMEFQAMEHAHQLIDRVDVGAVVAVLGTSGLMLLKKDIHNNRVTVNIPIDDLDLGTLTRTEADIMVHLILHEPFMQALLEGEDTSLDEIHVYSRDCDVLLVMTLFYARWCCRDVHQKTRLMLHWGGYCVDMYDMAETIWCIAGQPQDVELPSLLVHFGITILLHGSDRHKAVVTRGPQALYYLPSLPFVDLLPVSEETGKRHIDDGALRYAMARADGVVVEPVDDVHTLTHAMFKQMYNGRGLVVGSEATFNAITTKVLDALMFYGQFDSSVNLSFVLQHDDQTLVQQFQATGDTLTDYSIDALLTNNAQATAYTKLLNESKDGLTVANLVLRQVTDSTKVTVVHDTKSRPDPSIDLRHVKSAIYKVIPLAARAQVVWDYVVALDLEARKDAAHGRDGDVTAAPAPARYTLKTTCNQTSVTKCLKRIEGLTTEVVTQIKTSMLTAAAQRPGSLSDVVKVTVSDDRVKKRQRGELDPTGDEGDDQDDFYAN